MSCPFVVPPVKMDCVLATIYSLQDGWIMNPIAREGYQGGLVFRATSQLVVSKAVTRKITRAQFTTSLDASPALVEGACQGENRRSPETLRFFLPRGKARLLLYLEDSVAWRSNAELIS